MSETKEKSSAVMRLMQILDEHVGNETTGYYGSVRVNDNLISAIKAANSELPELLRFRQRLQWLHSGAGIRDADGYEWGVARIKFDERGQVIGALWTCGDHSDLDLEMATEKLPTT